MNPVDSLMTLLTVESLLLAVVSMAITMAAPGGPRVANFPIPAPVLAGSSVAVLALVATGSTAAWAQLYVGGSWRPFPDIVIAATLLVAILAEPLLALALALGMRTED